MQRYIDFTGMASIRRKWKRSNSDMLVTGYVYLGDRSIGTTSTGVFLQVPYREEVLLSLRPAPLGAPYLIYANFDYELPEPIVVLLPY